MFCQSSFLTILSIGFVFSTNEMGTAITENVSTKASKVDRNEVTSSQTKLDQVEVASTSILKDLNQINEAQRVQGEPNKKRMISHERKVNLHPSNRETAKKRMISLEKKVLLNPKKRRAGGRSFGAPKITYNETAIKSGTYFYTL